MEKMRVARDSAYISSKKTSSNPYLYLISSIADTTWRMFVPTIALLLVGNYLDDMFGTSPWLMFVGTSIGAVIALVLVKRQLARGRDDV